MQGFVKDFVVDENGTQAALKNYDIEGENKENIAASIAKENLTKPQIIEAINSERKSLKQALLDKGITEDYLADKVNVLLSAKDRNGDTDFTAVDKGLKHATNIYGVVDPNDKPAQTTYNFIFNPEVQQQVQVINATIKAQLLKKYEPIQEN